MSGPTGRRQRFPRPERRVRRGRRVRIGAGPGEKGGADGGDGHEVQGPVVAVLQATGHNCEGQRVPGRRSAEHRDEGQHPQARQQDDERVHAGFGVVVHGEGRSGHEQRRRPRHCPTGPPVRNTLRNAVLNLRLSGAGRGRAPGLRADPVAGDPHDRERDNTDDPRQRTRPEVARSEHPHPEMEEHVVQRRCPVVAKQMWDQVQWGPGDVDRQRLVQPHWRRRPETQHDCAGEHGPTCRGDNGLLGGSARSAGARLSPSGRRRRHLG